MKGTSLNGQTLTLSNVQTGSASTSTTLSTEGNLGFSNTQPSLAINYLIATRGANPGVRRRNLETEGGEGLADLDDAVLPESRSHRRLGQDPFVGEVIMFAGNAVPFGWAACNGQFLPITNNAALFGIIGTTFGGNGQTNFGVPDLSGRVPIGIGQGSGLSSRILGDKVGSETTKLTAANLPGHTHGIPTITAITVAAP